MVNSTSFDIGESGCNARHTLYKSDLIRLLSADLRVNDSNFQLLGRQLWQQYATWRSCCGRN